MSDFSGHLARYKLDTEFINNGVSHRTINSNIITGHRRIEVQTTWFGEQKLGVGSYGEVFLQRETSSGQLRAVKVVPNHMKKMKLNELNALIMLQDRTDLFVTFLGWYEDPRVVYIAMEYIEHGDLDQYIIADRARARLEAPVISLQILEGLVVLHQRQICHRDLKPQVKLPGSVPSYLLIPLQNILVASVSPIWVKITDFGISKGWTGTALRTHCGTSSYKAPELSGLLPREMRSSGQSYGESVDIWALGVIVHQLLTTEIPFHRIDEQTTESSYYDTPQWNMDYNLVQDYCADPSLFPLGPLNDSRASPKAIDFVKSLMVPDPKKRPSAVEALKSEWLYEKVTTLPFNDGSSITVAPALLIILIVGPKPVLKKFPKYLGLRRADYAPSSDIRAFEVIKVGIQPVQLIIGPDYNPHDYERQFHQWLEQSPGRKIHGIIFLCPSSTNSSVWDDLAMSLKQLSTFYAPYFGRSMITFAQCHTVNTGELFGHTPPCFVLDWNSPEAAGMARGIGIDGIQKQGMAMIAHLTAQEHKARISHRVGTGFTMVDGLTKEFLLASRV